VLREFESRLADVLGTRLAAPLAGAVDVQPGRLSARVVLGVRRADPVDEDLLNIRPERVPGAVAPRRVLKLRCQVDLEFRSAPGGTREDVMTAIDSTLYLLGEPAFRDGSVLLPDDADSDPGFLIRRMRFVQAELPATASIEAEGFFWPVGQAGQSGPTIIEARIRQTLQPLRLVPARPNLVAAGAAVELRVEFGAAGTFRVEQDDVNLSPYGSLIVSVIDAGGRPGAGTLSGGSDGPGGSRVLPFVEGAVTLQYTPPDAPASDQLVIAIEDGEGGAGIELGRFQLRVRGA
jgi:hypothetical protein